VDGGQILVLALEGVMTVMSKPTLPALEPSQLAAIPIVDAHCHAVRPLDERLTVSSLERRISLSFMEQNQPDRGRRPLVRDWPGQTLPRPTLMLTYLYRHLAEFLGVPPEPEQVVAAREERAQDYPAYVQSLMRDAGIAQLVVDSGYPGDVPNDEFAAVTRLPVWEVLRIETVMSQAAAAASEFDGFVETVRARLDAGLRDPTCVGLKSVIAYCTGLAIGPEDPAAAAAEYAAFRQQPETRGFKALRDYFFHLGLKLCLAHDKPLQVHSGFGDDDIYFSRSAVRYLHDLLAFPPYSDCLVVLVHGGHPWAGEAAIMASLLPNVYLDISQSCPFISYGVADLLWEVLQVAPPAKVMYGSDAFHLPELYWLGARLGRYAVGTVVDRLVSAGFATADEGQQLARGILYDHAVDLYALPG
jgi:uncharacterized protein